MSEGEVSEDDNDSSEDGSNSEEDEDEGRDELEPDDDEWPRKKAKGKGVLLQLSNTVGLPKVPN